MNLNDIKAPSALKEQTIALMKKQDRLRGSHFVSAAMIRPAIPAALATCCLLLAVTLFSVIPAARKNTIPGSEDMAAHTADESQTTIPSTGEGQFIQVTEGSRESMAPGLVTSEPAPYFSYPLTDSSSDDAITAIKSGFSVQKPLSDYRVSSAFNDFQVNGTALHPEVDMAAAEGTEIYPLCEGTVLETGFTAILGNYIVIDHGEGLVSTYGHCREVLVSPRDTVTSASAIGTVGKTGAATGPFLSFSVTLNGEAVNPEKLFE